MKLRDENGRGREIKYVLYVADTVLMTDSREVLQPIANKFKT